MFEKFSPEYQVNKRVRSFLLHVTTQGNIDAGQAKLLFRMGRDKATAHLYDGNHHVKEISIQSILEFFGQDYEDSHREAITVYLEKLSKEQKIELEKLNVVICDVKGVLGVHIYEETKYRKKTSTLDLISHFYFNKHE